MCSHYNCNNKNIKKTTITIFLILSRSDFFDARTMIKCFQQIKIKLKGKGRAFHLFAHTSRSNGVAHGRANHRSTLHLACPISQKVVYVWSKCSVAMGESVFLCLGSGWEQILHTQKASCHVSAVLIYLGLVGDVLVPVGRRGNFKH